MKIYNTATPQKKSKKRYLAHFIATCMPFQIYGDNSSCTSNPELMSSSMKINISEVTLTIPIDGKTIPISPYIYGHNDHNYLKNANMTFQRQGGNRFTGYNWENNASHAGEDWEHSSDSNLSPSLLPGKVWIDFINQGKIRGTKSIVTLQMAGHVAADRNGPVLVTEVAPSSRWKEIRNYKKSSLNTQPDTSDGFVYMDEAVHFLVQKFGRAIDGGVFGYSLDNEPCLWSSTHPRIHPVKPTYSEVLSKSISLSTIIKNHDPSAKVWGGVLYGWNSYTDGAWDELNGTWFIDQFLRDMATQDKILGKRLLDVIDIHWYPESRGDGKRIVFEGGITRGSIEARLQAPRSLWDTTYTENSWIAKHVTKGPIVLLPELHRRISESYPGTYLSISEWDFGETSHWSGGLACADALGVFGREKIYSASPWGELGIYASKAFELYRNYDGKNSTYGDLAISASSSNNTLASVFASLSSQNNSNLNIIVINKSYLSTIATFQLQGSHTYREASVWGFDAHCPEITNRKRNFNINSASFQYDLPPHSALHFVIKANETFIKQR